VASILLNASADQKNTLINYANHIGLAFQIADDLLDLVGNEVSMGKPIRQDTKNEITNFVKILGKEKATKRALEESSKAINLIHKFKQESENLVSLAKYTVNRNK
jgi:geranylgeranyl diphosphate synthase type II